MNGSPLLLIILLFTITTAVAEPWRRHVIDNGSRGADGVRLGDVNQDGLPDIVTGWEEGGRIRICLQPTTVELRKGLWQTIEVARVKSPEDAVFADINRDGWLDVVSCCEGKQQDAFVHLNPGNADQLMDKKRWTTSPVPGAKDFSRWMFCEPLPDGRLVLGSKEPNAQIAIWNPNDPESGLQLLRRSSWIMSLRAIDVDDDGNVDIVYSDRKGAASQVGWLKNSGPDRKHWHDHLIGGRGKEVMFLDIRQVNDSAGADSWQVACNTKGGGVLLMQPSADVSAPWLSVEIPITDRTGSGKGVAFSDVNGDGRIDLVCTCEHAENAIGVFWLESSQGGWKFHDISGAENGVKFDRIEMLDLDGDGDDDVLTCEERDNLGVVWYENPH